MSSNKKKNNQTTKETKMTAEITNNTAIETENTDTDTPTEDTTEGTIEDTAANIDNIALIPEAVIPTKVPLYNNPQLQELTVLIDEYIDSISSKDAALRTEEHIIRFVRIGKYLAQKDKTALIEYFFKTLIVGNSQYLMGPELVFQYINSINDADKIKVETLYTALLALNNYLKKPKKFGFPLDLDRIRESFTGESLTTFIKKYVD